MMIPAWGKVCCFCSILLLNCVSRIGTLRLHEYFWLSLACSVRESSFGLVRSYDEHPMHSIDLFPLCHGLVGHGVDQLRVLGMSSFLTNGTDFYGVSLDNWTNVMEHLTLEMGCNIMNTVSE